MLQEKVLVTHKKNDKMRGYIFSENFIPMLNTETKEHELVCQIGVLWDKPRTPAISYHHPSDLVWIELQPVALDLQEDEATEEDEDDETEEDDGTNNYGEDVDRREVNA